MKIMTTALISVSFLALCVLADNSKSAFENMIMPEVNIKPLVLHEKGDPFLGSKNMEMTNLVQNGNFAIRAKNLTVKEFLETLCFLTDMSCCFSNGNIIITERYVQKSVIDCTHKEDIIKIANKIIIPEITMRPPATIVDASDFFYQASKDYDDPEKPEHQRGINFAVKSFRDIRTIPASLKAKGPTIIGAGSSKVNTLLEAIKHVCDQTNAKYVIYGKTIIFLPKDDCK